MIPVPSVNSPSCCARMRACLTSRQTIQAAKVTALWVSSMTAIFIPVPFLNGFVSASLLFLGMHEMTKCEDAACMLNSELRIVILSRTWKHIPAGAFISGIGFGLSTLALNADLPVLTILGLFGSLGIAANVAYRDWCWPGDYSRFVILNNEPPLAPPHPPSQEVSAAMA